MDPETQAASMETSTSEIPDNYTGDELVADRASFSLGSDTPPPPPNPFLQEIPEEYREQGWAKKLAAHENPKEAMWKDYANAQKLIGQRSVSAVPGENATPEERQAFHKALGVPDNVEDYKIENTQWAPEEKELGEYLDKTRNPNVLKAVAQAAKDQGIPPQALNKVIQAFEKSQVVEQRAVIEAARAAEAADDADFRKLSREHFGDRAPQVLDHGKKVIQQYVPPGVQPLLHQLDAKGVVILAAALDGVFKRHVHEDGITRPTESMTAKSVDEIKREGESMMKDPAYTDIRHKDHEEMKAKVINHFKQLSNLNTRR